MLDKGRVWFDRKITKWRWYKDMNTFKLFFHLILTANYQDSDFENITVKRGQRVASIRSLSAETGLSEKQVRTAIKHLKETQEVAHTPTPKYSVFTILNYDLYQQRTHETANEGQTKGKRGANEGQQLNKDKKDKKDKKYKGAPAGAKKSVLGRGGGHTDF